MSILKQLKSELENIRENIRISQNEEDKKKVEIADFMAKYDIGDIVITKRKEKFKIESFKLSYCDETEYWGRKLKKDGNPRKGDQNEIWEEFTLFNKGEQ